MIDVNVYHIQHLYRSLCDFVRNLR